MTDRVGRPLEGVTTTQNFPQKREEVATEEDSGDTKE